MGCVYMATNNIDGKSYVGKTIFSLEKRKAEHKKKSEHPKVYFHKALKKHGFDCFIWQVLFESEEEEQLFEKEQEYIAAFNLTDDRFGYNQTGGGQGGVPNEKTRKALSKAQAKNTKTEAYKKAHGEAVRRMVQTKEWREKVSASSKEVWSRKEYREKMLEKIKNYPSDPEWRKKHLEAVRKNHQTEEWKRKTEEARIKVMGTEEWKQAHLSGIREMIKRPGFLEKRNEALRKAKRSLFVCIETGAIFNSRQEAAVYADCNVNKISRSCLFGCIAGKYRFRYGTEEEKEAFYGPKA